MNQMPNINPVIRAGLVHQVTLLISPVGSQGVHSGTVNVADVPTGLSAPLSSHLDHLSARVMDWVQAQISCFKAHCQRRGG
uniref:Uncharacterized protein n=1 Tax=Knipowitschia caucasica TaxID=637954 RepID=A0AAV2LCB9_KNICA